MRSLAFLWAFVKPGGIYIIEDMQTAYVQDFIDHPITAVDYVHRLQMALHRPSHAVGLDPKAYIGFGSVLDSLDSVHCFPEACVMVKRPLGALPRSK